jgi:hypothetical protein
LDKLEESERQAGPACQERAVRLSGLVDRATAFQL